MPRGYRCIILAAFGWLILCGAQPPAKQTDSPNGSRQAAPAASTTPAPTPSPAPSSSAQFTAYGQYDSDPCYRSKDANAADLCAYWRAAIAAEKSAHEARRATNWAIFATFLSFAGLCGIIWSLMQTQGALAEARRGNRNALLFEKRARRESREASADTKTALAHAESNVKATKALVEVSEKTAKQAAAIARDGQRAWVTVGIQPINARRFRMDGLYLMADLITENIGETIATHFEIRHEVFFKGQHESIDDLNGRIEDALKEFKADYSAPASSCLIPKDITINHAWETKEGDEIDWWTNTIFGDDMAQPIFVGVAFYRTIHHPEIVQMSWRSWYFSEKMADGQASTFISRRTDNLDGDRLTADPLRSTMMHEPYPAAPDEA